MNSPPPGAASPPRTIPVFKDAGRRLADLLAANLARAERSEGSVLAWADPAAAVRDARALLRDGPEAPPARADGPDVEGQADAVDRFAELIALMLQRGLNLHDPRYIGHQVPAPVPIAGLFDAAGSVTNQCMAI